MLSANPASVNRMVLKDLISQHAIAFPVGLQGLTLEVDVPSWLAISLGLQQVPHALILLLVLSVQLNYPDADSDLPIHGLEHRELRALYIQGEDIHGAQVRIPQYRAQRL